MSRLNASYARFVALAMLLLAGASAAAAST